MISSPAVRRDPEAGWDEMLRDFETALTGGDAAAVGRIAIAVQLGPLPAEFEERMIAVLEGIARLEREVADRLAAVSGELDRLPIRSRWSAPPAPSQLDCSA